MANGGVAQSVDDCVNWHMRGRESAASLGAGVAGCRQRGSENTLADGVFEVRRKVRDKRVPSPQSTLERVSKTLESFHNMGGKNASGRNPLLSREVQHQRRAWGN